MDQADGLREMATLMQTKFNQVMNSRGELPRVMAVTSGKGGVGKTNVTVNLAVAMGKLGKRVLILDADLSLGNVDVLLGLTPKYTLDDVINGDRRVSEVMVEGPDGVMILPAANGIRELTTLGATQRTALLERLDPLSRDFDVVLLDTAPGISSNVIFFALLAEEITVIISPEPYSLTDSYALIKVLSRDHAHRRFRVLVNMAKSANEGLTVFRKLARVTDQYLDVSMDYLGCVPHDEMLTEAVLKQAAVVDAFPRARSSRVFSEVARRMINHPFGEPLLGKLELFRGAGNGAVSAV